MLADNDWVLYFHTHFVPLQQVQSPKALKLRQPDRQTQTLYEEAVEARVEDRVR